jgi:hypothetical protein
MMDAALLEQISSVNQALFPLFEETRRALAGQADFNSELVRKLSIVVGQMDPILPRSKELRSAHPELAAPLDHYLRLAADLRADLDKIHMMLLARRDALDAARAHIQAASQFVSALSSTR